MSHEPSNDPRNLWQSQETEDFVMSMQQIRQAAARHAARAQYNKNIFYAAFAGYILVSVAARDTGLSWLVLLRVVLGAIWILYLPRYREQPVSLGLSAAAEGNPGLEFYRKELTMERDYFRSPSKWAVAVVYMSVIFVTSLAMGWAVAIPISVAFGVFLLWFYLQRKQALPGIEQELRALDALR